MWCITTTSACSASASSAEPGAAGRLSERGEIDDRQRRRGGRIDELQRAAAGGDEAGAQRLVPAHHLGESAREERAVEVAAQQCRERQVVGGGPGVELGQEPHPLLRERERCGVAARLAADRREGGESGAGAGGCAGGVAAQLLDGAR